MASSSFVLALVQIAQEEGNTLSLESIRNLAFQKLASGEAKSIVNSSLNGTSFSFTVSKAADVLFSEVSEAIRIFNAGTVTSTLIDFSFL